MEVTKSPGGYLLIEYEPADVRSLNASLGTDFYPHAGAVLFDSRKAVVWRNIPPGIPDRPPLMLAWELRRVAEKEGS